jgi:hypothetical protein
LFQDAKESDIRRNEHQVITVKKFTSLRQRERTNWNGWLWVPEQTLTQMPILLTNFQPLWLEIHERKIERTR